MRRRFQVVEVTCVRTDGLVKEALVLLFLPHSSLARRWMQIVPHIY